MKKLLLILLLLSTSCFAKPVFDKIQCTYIEPIHPKCLTKSQRIKCIKKCKTRECELNCYISDTEETCTQIDKHNLLYEMLCF